MFKMLLSIKPEYVERIIKGEKRYEYRKFRCRKDVNKIIIYATAPQKQVVAEADIADIIEDDIFTVWDKTKLYAGITYDAFKKYYQGKEKAIAYKLSNILVYDRPLTLEDIGVTTAPQSCRYIL